MNWEEKAANDIINNCITINTLKEGQRKATTDLGTAAKLIEERVNQMIERWSDDEQFDFINHIPVKPDKGGVTAETLDLIYEYAVKNYWAGYTKGFKDREDLFSCDSFSGLDNEKEETPAGAPTSTGESL